MKTIILLIAILSCFTSIHCDDFWCQSHYCVSNCLGFDCQKQEGWCPPGSPGAHGNWWNCCNKKWVKNNDGSGCADIKNNQIYEGFEEQSVIQNLLEKNLLDLQSNPDLKKNIKTFAPHNGCGPNFDLCQNVCSSCMDDQLCVVTTGEQCLDDSPIIGGSCPLNTSPCWQVCDTCLDEQICVLQSGKECVDTKLKKKNIQRKNFFMPHNGCGPNFDICQNVCSSCFDDSLCVVITGQQCFGSQNKKI